MKESVFKTLSTIDCSNKVEKKNGLTYLSWAWAWGITKEKYPDANYKVQYFDGKPYLFDADLGYMVSTEVTIDGETIPMHLPVMDYRNNAQKNVQYKNRNATVEPATMFDINTAIMRCLTKNLAMFGLGHYIYAGEDLPGKEAVEMTKGAAMKLLEMAETNDQLKASFLRLPKSLQTDKDVIAKTNEMKAKWTS